MKKKLNTRHHFIPQCYFRNFSSSKTSIYAYDKLESKTFSLAIGKICCKDEYYSVLAKNVINKDSSREKELIVEKDFFADFIEPQFNIL